MDNTKVNFIEKISLWWRFDGRYLHKAFIQGVKNLWRWFPVIWKDRDWDQHYIYEILSKKLQFQSKYIGERDFHTEAKRDAERMNLVVKLIKLQQEDFYGMEYMDYHKTNFTFDPIDGGEFYEMKSEEVSENFDEYFKKYPLQYKRVVNGELNRYRRPFEEKDNKVIAMEIAHGNQERCQNLIFKIMNNHIERWWD
jgi:hypothetical protein